MSRIKILMLFGGESTEHEVSVASAKNVQRALDSNKYEITLCFIDRDGRWWLADEVIDQIADNSVEIYPALGQKAFVIEGEIHTFDVILPILHGSNGEDGSVQALAQLLHIPIVGCDMTASAVAMNKYITKQVAAANDIPIVPFSVHNASDPAPSLESLAKEYGSTVFVKPAGSGSSVGVSKVVNQEELGKALQEAHKHDKLALIEQAMDVRELEVAVLGNYPDVKASVVGEIKPDREFYSYESKYDQASTSEVVIPADIPPETSDVIRDLATRIFTLIGGSGLSRIDFFLDNTTGEVFFNEVNTIPGFTDISMYSKLWQSSGIEYKDLIEQLIELALKK
jgi:D-alanine-D-alanine ligase